MNEIEKVEKLCKLLRNEDPNFLKILGNMSPDTRLKIVSVTRENEKGNKTSNIISKLINRYPSKVKLPQNILGPISLVQMEHPKYPHIFYMFGDHHSKQPKNCENFQIIDEFLEEIINKTPVFTDVYLEVPYKYKTYQPKIKKTETYINNIYERFSECIYSAEQNHERYFFSGKRDKCPTSRFHYVDLRQYIENNEQYIGFWKFAELINLSSKNSDLSYWNRKDFRRLNIYIDYIKRENTFIRKRLEKQFSNIEDDYLRDKLRENFRSCLEKNKIDNLGYEERRNKTKIENFIKKFLFYGACLFDYYVLARIFRKYKKRGSEYNWSSYNNILYLGQQHIENIKNILQSLGFVDVFSTYKDHSTLLKNNPPSQCLGIKGLKPFFHQRY